MLLSSGLWSLAGAMTWPFYSLYILELGGKHIDIGFISALGALVRIVPTLFGGYLADALGRKKILYSMSFLLAVNELLLGFAPDYRYLYLAAAVEALASGLREPAFTSIFADSTTPGNRALSFALWQVVPPLFGLLSPYAIGRFMDVSGVVAAMRLAYIFTFVMGVAASLLRYRFIEETLTDGKGVEGGFKDAARGVLADFRDALRTLPVDLWIFLSIDFVFTFAWAVSEPYFVTYAKEEVGLTAAQWGLATVLLTVVNTTLKPPAAWASDRYGRVKFIFACMLIWPAAFVLFGRSGSFQAIMLAQLLIAVSGSLGDPAWEALFVDYQPKEYRGRFTAIASLSWSLIWGAGNIVGGAIYQGYSKAMVFNLSAGLFAVGALAALLKVREPATREV